MDASVTSGEIPNKGRNGEVSLNAMFIISRKKDISFLRNFSEMSLMMIQVKNSLLTVL